MNGGVGFALARALGGRPDGARAYRCNCPVPRHGGHGWADREGSLTIREKGGELTITCGAGCSSDDVRRHVERIAARRRIVLPAATSGGKA